MVGTIAVAPTIPNPNIIVRISNADSLKAWIIPKLHILEEGFQMVGTIWNLGQSKWRLA